MGTTVRWVSSFLKNRPQITVVNNHYDTLYTSTGSPRIRSQSDTLQYVNLTSQNSIDPVCLQKRCSHVNKKGQKEVPQWVDSPTGEQFRPSFNIAPTTFLPVLMASYNAPSFQGDESRALMPMRWGLIPQWHKGERKAFKTMHNNCRAETVGEKATFSRPLSKGRRCALVTQGFYEWKTERGQKTPYLFCFSNNQDGKTDFMKNSPKKEWSAGECGQVEKYDQHTITEDDPLLYIACVYDVWHGEEADLYSFSILTTEASSAVSDVHHRMPVILETEEELDRWLDCSRYPYGKVQDIMHQKKTCLRWYPVANKVNNVRNQDKDCILVASADSETKKTKTIKDFFAIKTVKRKSEPSVEDESKKIKTEIK